MFTYVYVYTVYIYIYVCVDRQARWRPSLLGWFGPCYLRSRCAPCGLGVGVDAGAHHDNPLGDVDEQDGIQGCDQVASNHREHRRFGSVRPCSKPFSAGKTASRIVLKGKL